MHENPRVVPFVNDLEMTFLFTGHTKSRNIITTVLFCAEEDSWFINIYYI
jgi:hypothetical protein